MFTKYFAPEVDKGNKITKNNSSEIVLEELEQSSSDDCLSAEEEEDDNKDDTVKPWNKSDASKHRLTKHHSVVVPEM